MSKTISYELSNATIKKLSEIVGFKSIEAKEGDKIIIDLASWAGSIHIGSYSNTNYGIHAIDGDGLLADGNGTIRLSVEKSSNNDALLAYLDVSSYMSETQTIVIYEGDVTNINDLSDIPDYGSVLGVVEFTLGNFSTSNAGYIYTQSYNHQVYAELVRA